MVITFGSDPNNPGSNPGGTFFYLMLVIVLPTAPVGINSVVSLREFLYFSFCKDLQEDADITWVSDETRNWVREVTT